MARTSLRSHPSQRLKSIGAFTHGARPRLIAVFAAVLLASAGCGPRDDAPPATGDAEPTATSRFLNVTDASAGYVGDAVCATCHESEWSGFQSHGMANSYYPLTADNAVEDFPVDPIRHPVSGWFYRPIRTDSGFFQEEYRIGDGGEVDHRLRRRMDFVVGSGTAARTYLNESGGRLYQLPLTWYTQTRRWDFSPGYETSDRRFSREIVDRCMACHNSYPESVPFVEGKYVEVPNGIGCERCHGPGSIHADARLVESEAPGEIDYTILNPDHVGLELQLDVCQQCHLQTTVSLLRDGAEPFGYRPGIPLEQHVALYYSETEQEEADEIDVISHADRMKQSACFVGSLESASPMTCVTCHDPHEGFRDVGERYFDPACQSCHPGSQLDARFANEPQLLDTHTAGPACASCHMPKVQAEDVTHASFTDHWIRVVGGTREDAARSFAPADVRPQPAHDSADLRPYFAADTARADEPIYRGMAYVVLGRQQADDGAFRRGIDELASALDGRSGEHGEAWFLLGWARLNTGDAASAIEPLEESIRIDPVPERLNALAQALEAANISADRVPGLYARALDRQPAAADIRVNYGRFLEQSGRVQQALVEYQRAAEEKPRLAEAHYNLGTAYLRTGSPERAERSLREAISLEPNYDQALGNLGLLYASTNRAEDAGRMFRRALEAAPRSAVANANLGTFHLSGGRPAAAVPLFETAIEIDPDYVDARLNLAVAYFQTDQPARAIEQAREAQRLDPANQRAAEILQALQ